jgi:hypothetical protein
VALIFWTAQRLPTDPAPPTACAAITVHAFAASPDRHFIPQADARLKGRYESLLVIDDVLRKIRNQKIRHSCIAQFSLSSNQNLTPKASERV